MNYKIIFEARAASKFVPNFNENREKILFAGNLIGDILYFLTQWAPGFFILLKIFLRFAKAHSSANVKSQNYFNIQKYMLKSLIALINSHCYHHC